MLISFNFTICVCKMLWFWFSQLGFWFWIFTHFVVFLTFELLNVCFKIHVKDLGILFSEFGELFSCWVLSHLLGFSRLLTWYKTSFLLCGNFLLWLELFLQFGKMGNEQLGLIVPELVVCYSAENLLKNDFCAFHSSRFRLRDWFLIVVILLC